MFLYLQHQAGTQTSPIDFLDRVCVCFVLPVSVVCIASSQECSAAQSYMRETQPQLTRLQPRYILFTTSCHGREGAPEQLHNSCNKPTTGAVQPCSMCLFVWSPMLHNCSNSTCSSLLREGELLAVTVFPRLIACLVC